MFYPMSQDTNDCRMGIWIKARGLGKVWNRPAGRVAARGLGRPGVFPKKQGKYTAFCTTRMDEESLDWRVP